MRHFLTAIPIALLSGTAPAHAEGTWLREADYRVATLAYRIATAAPRLCPRQGPVSGIAFHHLADYEATDRPAMAAAGLDRGPGILAVVAGSPADRAGLRAGDVLLAIDGKAFQPPVAIAAAKDRRASRRLTDASETQFNDALAAGPVSLTLWRQGTTLTVRLEPRAGCLYRVRLANSAQRTAVAASPYILVSSAVVSLADNDDELAFLIAHEMAHVVLDHGAQLRAKGIPRDGMARGFGRNGAFVRRTEDEADELGGRMMLAAGMDPGRGAMIVARMGAAVTMFGLFQTHADDADRIRRMRELSAEPRPAS